jgi:predicted alpha-1,2-mannosidase
MHKHTLCFCLCLLIYGAGAQNAGPAVFVDPIIGTDAHGHTYPGPCMPFGMVQLSPDTRLTGWDGCSGYHYSDKAIYGFSHTHLSGTGCPDYGDIMLMPTTGKLQLGQKQYASPFKHSNEKAGAGYYSVLLDKYDVKAELTVTPRTGLHQYTFPKSADAHIILDLKHRDKVEYSEINISDNGEVSGERLSAWWADSQYVFFVIKFSKPFSGCGISKGGILHKGLKHAKGDALKAWFNFETADGEVIEAKVGISAVSIEGARKNLETEQPGWDFEGVLKQAQNAWNKELSKIEFGSHDTAVLRTFYTAMYHCLINPNLYSDVDGRYRGRDLQVHDGTGSNYYTVFSLWDTYRALHPLYNLIERKTNGEIVNTFVTQYKQKGLLPIWELAGCETFCMTGYHSVSVIADAALKGVDGFDANTAYEAMKHSATISQRDTHRYFKLKTGLMMISFIRYADGWTGYLKTGYVHSSMVLGSVSKTLEYAYDDWCIAQMAQKLGKTDDYNYFIKRAANYRNVLDTASGFMRPRKKNFVHRFDPCRVTLQYTEGNGWQYSFDAPQDLSGHIARLGGKERFATKLDSLFATNVKLKGFHDPDVSGMIGQYAHGNEPSHHIAYLYNYAAQPFKTQHMVRRIMNELYTDKPDGLCGNEDCGQMSAWYVFSAVGFYPVCPGSSQYAIGSPAGDKAVIHFANGKSFTVTAKNNSKQNVYIQSAKLNGSNYTKCYIDYADLMLGGELELTMGNQPNPAWGSGNNDVPVTKIE